MPSLKNTGLAILLALLYMVKLPLEDQAATAISHTTFMVIIPSIKPISPNFFPHALQQLESGSACTLIQHASGYQKTLSQNVINPQSILYKIRQDLAGIQAKQAPGQ